MESTILKPFLIQRGSFKGIKEENILGLDSLISYDYMGSLEFEWGALPTSLKRMTSSWNEYVCEKVEEINDANGTPLYLICKKSQKEDIVKVIFELASQSNYNDTKNRLKEGAYLDSYIRCDSLYERPNFWWDVTSNDCLFNSVGRLGTGNDWMICFGKNHARKLLIAINKVCEKHSTDKNEKIFEGISEAIEPEILYSDIKCTKFFFSLIEHNYKKNVLCIFYPDGTKISINTRGIVELDDSDPDLIKIKVESKSGKQRFIEIKMTLSSKRSIICGILKDYPQINKIKNGSFKQKI